MRQKMFRRRSFIEYDTLGTTDSNVVLFTAEEVCTIRRIIGYIGVDNGGSSLRNVTNFSIEVAPNGTLTNTAFAGQSLDFNVTAEYLGGGLLLTGTSDTNNIIAQTDKVMWETKGMRKMRKGDQLVISHSSENANGRLSAYFDIFVSL